MKCSGLNLEPGCTVLKGYGKDGRCANKQHRIAIPEGLATRFCNGDIYTHMVLSDEKLTLGTSNQESFSGIIVFNSYDVSLVKVSLGNL